MDLTDRLHVRDERSRLIADVKRSRKDDGSEGGGSGKPWKPTYLEEGHDHCMDGTGVSGHEGELR